MSRPVAAPVELTPTSSSRAARWVRRLFVRGAPRARVVAPPELHLGDRLDVEWGLDCPAGDLATIRVSLMGTEIARQRISARSGISVISDTRHFVVLDIARAVPDRGVRVATGRGSVDIPAGAVPSLPGRYNEIAWTIVVHASFRLAPDADEAPDLHESFPLRVLPPGAT
jgi:hypothetical protein